MLAEKGFYLWIPNHEYFLISDRKNITGTVKKLFTDKIKESGVKITDYIEYHINNGIRKAEYTMKILNNGMRFVNISGDDFGGHGDENTIVFCE